MTAGSVVCPRLYPEITDTVDDAVQPFTVEQLQSLYYNYELEHIDEFVDAFLLVIIISLLF